MDFMLQITQPHLSHLSNHFLLHFHMPMAVLIVYILQKDHKKKKKKKKLNEKENVHVEI